MKFGNIPYLICKIRFEAPKRQRGREVHDKGALAKYVDYLSTGY
jgi:hypothetical protein